MIWTIIGIGWVVASVVVIVAQARELRRRERKYRLLVRAYTLHAQREEGALVR